MSPPTLVKHVSLNIDLGELRDEPEALWELATQANVACGGHAGDAGSMRRALLRARAHGVRVFAHPSFPDREGFGRRELALSAAELTESVREQCRALLAVALEEGVAIEGVKAHGALYHVIARDRVLANAVVEGARDIAGPWAVPPGAVVGELVGATVVEGFADRAYRADGSLVPRSEPGATLDDPAQAAAQAVRLAGSGRFRTLCVHGDGPNAVAVARAVRQALASGGFLAG